MGNKHLYAFGAFKLDPQQKILLCENERIPLHPKTFATLLALLECNGEVISKDDLMAKVWPDTFVDESNLTKNISHLRKAFRNGQDHSDYIETLSGVGYRFVEQVRFLEKGDGLKRRNGEVANEVREAAPPEENHALITSFIPPPLPSPHRVWLWSGLAIVIIVSASMAWFKWPHSVPIKSLAILPFNSLDTKEKDETLGLRLADALILRLSSLQQLQVRPVTVIRKYANQEFDPLVVGRELQVNAVLTGFVQHTDGRVRLTVRLVQTSDGQQLWADTIDYQSNDALLLQDVLTGQVAQALVPKLKPEEQQRLATQGTENAEARRLYVTGRFELNRRTGESMKKGIANFEEAVRLDPNYAAAWAGIADCWTILGQINEAPQAESILKAKAAVTKALVLDDSLIEVHASSALIKVHHEWDWEGAEREFRRAIALNPNHSTIWHWYAMYLSAQARHDDALQAIKQAEKLDPTSRIIPTNHGWILWCARRDAEALAQLQKTINLDPHFANAHAKLSFVYETTGKYAESVEERAKDWELSGAAKEAAEMRDTYARAGWQGYAQFDLQRVQKKAQRLYVNPKEFVLAHVRLGNKEQALEWLERGYAERSESVLYTKVDPRYKSLRSDPRFKKLLQQMRLVD